MVVNCLYCDREFDKSKTAIKSTYGRNFCSHSCSASLSNKNKRLTSLKTCVVCKEYCGPKKIFCEKCFGTKIHCKKCNVEFIIKKHSLCCSYKCSISLDIRKSSKEKLEKWIFGEWDGSMGKNFKISPIVRKFILFKNNHKCSVCNYNKRLEIHHVDGNSKNHRPENLQSLCIRCHGETDTFRGLNIKK